MKKLLCIVLVFVMCIGICGCQKTDVRGQITNDSETEVQSPEFSIGKAENNTYTNEFLGISCTLPSEWTFYSKDQIAELNNIVGEYADEELAKMLEKADIIYDMYATNTTDYSTINVNLEKVNAVTAIALDLKKNIEAQFDTITDSFTNMGYSDFNIEYEKLTVGGKEFDGAKITAKINDIEFYSKLLTFKKGLYVATVTVATLQSDATETILNHFTIK